MRRTKTLETKFSQAAALLALVRLLFGVLVGAIDLRTEMKDLGLDR